MSDHITEALLELHYHKAIVDAFAAVFGARFLRMLKPSTQQEAWVGFDQGWIYTSASTEDVYTQLAETIDSGGAQTDVFHLGYFLQFKVVRNLLRRSRFTPIAFTTPYCRSELSVSPNPTTGLSQHETLRRLALIQSAEVYYACPLFFDIDAIYESPDLDTLQIVDVAAAPQDIDDTDRHFIAFQSEADVAPHCCSEVRRGTGRRSSEWIRNEKSRPRVRTGQEVAAMIRRAKIVLSDVQRRRGRVTTWLPQSFTMLSFAPEPQQTNA